MVILSIKCVKQVSELCFMVKTHVLCEKRACNDSFLNVSVVFFLKW